MIRGHTAYVLLVYSAALVAEPAMTDTSYAAAIKQVSQGENGGWACIGRYRNANAELIRAGIRPNAVFIGDSITEFWAKQPDLL